jgi:hypothetical protein
MYIVQQLNEAKRRRVAKGTVPSICQVSKVAQKKAKNLPQT